MAVNFDVLLQIPTFDFWAVPMTFTPMASQPGQPAYAGRGILSTYTVEVLGVDDSIFSDQRTIVDIRESEFGVLPQQDDHVIIPKDCNGVAKGEWEVTKAYSNGGGQTTLEIRKWVTPAP
jgi:hypothetical protein